MRTAKERLVAQGLCLLLLATAAPGLAGVKKRERKIEDWPVVDLSQHPVLSILEFEMKDPRAASRQQQVMVRGAPDRLADYVAQVLEPGLFDRVIEGPDDEASPGAVILTGEITRYRPGSAFGRAMFAGVGSAHMDFTVRLIDASSQEKLVSFSDKKTWAWGGALGMSKGVADLEQNLAHELAIYLGRCRRQAATQRVVVAGVEPPSPEPVVEASSRYREDPEQFTLTLPEGWKGYDQSRSAAGELGYLNVIVFSPLELAELMQPTTDEAALERMKKTMSGLSTGAIECFTLNRHAATKGMSCGGFTGKAQKRVLRMVRESSLSQEGIEILEEPRAEPIDLGGCRGLRVRASWRTARGSNWEVDTRAVSDGEVLYLFFVRTMSEHFERNRATFELALVDLQLSVAG